MTAESANQRLSGRLRFGDPEQIEALHYLREVRRIADVLDLSSQSLGKRFTHTVILDGIAEFDDEVYEDAAIELVKEAERGRQRIAEIFRK